MRLQRLQTEKANSLKIPDGTAIPCEYIGQYFLFNDIIMKLIFCILKSFAFICLNNFSLSEFQLSYWKYSKSMPISLNNQSRRIALDQLSLLIHLKCGLNDINHSYSKMCFSKICVSYFVNICIMREFVARIHISP